MQEKLNILKRTILLIKIVFVFFCLYQFVKMKKRYLYTFSLPPSHLLINGPWATKYNTWYSGSAYGIIIKVGLLGRSISLIYLPPKNKNSTSFSVIKFTLMYFISIKSVGR